LILKREDILVNKKKIKIIYYMALPEQAPTLRAQKSFDSLLYAEKPERSEEIKRLNQYLKNTGRSNITKDDWREKDYSSDHYLNYILQTEPWIKFFNLRIPDYYLQDPIPTLGKDKRWTHKGWASHDGAAGDRRPVTAWDVIYRYQSGMYYEFVDDLAIARNNRINNQCLDWLFTQTPPITENIWVYRCEGSRSINNILERPCITRHLSTTLSFLYALNSEFCSLSRIDDPNIWKQWPHDGTSCNSKYVLNKRNFNIYSIFIPAGSHIIPIWGIKPGDLQAGLHTPQQSYMEEVRDASHEFYVYQKEVLLPRGGILRPYIRDDSIVCKHFPGREGITWVPIFQYYSPYNQSVRNRCVRYIEMDDSNTPHRSSSLHKVWDGRDWKSGYSPRQPRPLRGGKKERKYTRKGSQKRNKTKKN